MRTRSQRPLQQLLGTNSLPDAQNHLAGSQTATPVMPNCLFYISGALHHESMTNKYLCCDTGTLWLKNSHNFEIESYSDG